MQWEATSGSQKKKAFSAHPKLQNGSFDKNLLSSEESIMFCLDYLPEYKDTASIRSWSFLFLYLKCTKAQYAHY